MSAEDLSNSSVSRIGEILRRFIEQSADNNLKTKGLYPERIEGLGLRVSFGQGNAAEIPWIALLGAGQKVSNGIYPVFLYYKSADYLVLAYGISETNRPALNWGGAVAGRTSVSTFMREHGYKAERYGDSFVAATFADATRAVNTPEFDDSVSEALAEVLDRYRQVLPPAGGYKAPAEPSDGTVPRLAEEDAKMSAQLPLNQILFGPPGTGKTYATIDATLEILDPDFLIQNRENRTLLKSRFDELSSSGVVRFVTFHQSFSYEDFVEGLRAVTNDEKQLEYQVEPGIFKRLCDDARTQGAQQGAGIRSNPRIWKISINGTGPSSTLTYCLNNNEARVGWGRTGDLRQSVDSNDYYRGLGSGDKGTLRYFSEDMVPGDIVLCIHSAEMISAVGVVTGDYYYDSTPPEGVIQDYNHVRPVRWLYRDLKLSILPLNDGKQFTLKTVYLMERFTWGDLLAYLEKSGAKPQKPEASTPGRKPHVLIIDEINRGNVSRIFGELITLIEPSKREGADEALSLELPYSKKPFSVPDNVYLIGTMNTADRSLAGMDIALRRRFTFREMPPRPDLLNSVLVEGVNIGQMLEVMNQRIELLLDREHCLGHAYFMPLTKPNHNTLETLARIFQQQILPLLQEYFFEDWERIQWVLNDHRKDDADRFVLQVGRDVEVLFGDGVNLGNKGGLWQVNEDAFMRVEAYLKIIDSQAVAKAQVPRQETLHSGFRIRQLESGSIEVWKDESLVKPSKPALRSIAKELGLEIHNSNGVQLNTRQLGRAVIRALGAQQ